MMTDIAIVGGGAAAVLVLGNLARQDFKRPLSITVFDKTGVFGKGIAYQTQNPAHLLNVRAQGMSAFAHDPAHFEDYAKTLGYRATDFVPRKDYADYLAGILNEAENKLTAAGHSLNFVQDEIVDVKQDCVIGQKDVYPARHIVLATGNNRNISPAGVENLSVQDGYYAEPWLLDDHRPDGAENVFVLGTGLSMVDTVIALLKAGHKGKITAISRNGLMPMPHIETVNPVSYNEDVITASPAQVLRRIRQHIKGGNDWRGAIDGLRPVTNDIWKNFSAHQKQVFKKRALTLWNVHRHRMAPEIAEQIFAAQTSGQFSVIQDCIEGLAKDTAGIIVQGKRKNYTAPCVINALGYGQDNRMGKDVTGLYRVGPALFGTLFETIAIPEIRQQSHDVAACLHSEIESSGADVTSVPA